MTQRFLRILGPLVLAVLVTGVVASAAGSGIESTPAPLPPKPDFSSMKFLSGTWTCTTKSSRRPASFVVTSSAGMDPTGYWMVTKSLSHKVSWAPYDIHSTDLVTYDAGSHRWVDIYTDDQGGYNVATSPGWNGNSIVWTDAVITTQGNVASTTPTTITKVSDSKTTALNKFKEKSGREISVTTSCSKG
jgi:hypothetical protein